MENNNISYNRISIQVSLSGYSFIVSGKDGDSRSPWMGADKIFTTPELQKPYGQVDISLLTPKVALVPSPFFNEQEAFSALDEVCQIDRDDLVEYVPVEDFDAVLVFSNSIGESLSRAVRATVITADGSTPRVLPEMYYMLKSLRGIKEYNKILVSYMDGYLHLAVAEGNTLKLCNVFRAPDFTTAEYYIFLVLKRLQLNPEISTIFFRTPLAAEQEMSLYRYFKAVEAL